MPHESKRFDLSSEPAVLEVYRGIVSRHGKYGGFFDVLAWRGGELLFVEFKGKGDRPNANEAGWIDAALNYGVKSTQLLFGEYASARRPTRRCS